MYRDPAGWRIPAHAKGIATMANAAAQSMRASLRRWTTESPRKPAISPPLTPPARKIAPEATPERATERPWTRVKNAGRKIANAYWLKFRKTPDAMIHQIVGMRRTRHIEARASGWGWSSLAPRWGSWSISRAGTRSSAGNAAKIMAARPPQAFAAGPPEKIATAAPV